MKTQYDSYDLFDHVDTHLTRPKFQTEREKRFYPSEASVEYHDEHGDKVIQGGCLRSSYYRLKGGFEGIPHDARTQFIFIQGNMVEDMMIKLWKEMGVWKDNNVKFIDKEHNISGEMDALLIEPDGTEYGVEVKSFYGYFAEKEIFGNKSTLGKPKLPQLLQTLIYLYNFRDRLPYFRMVYFGRDSVKRRTFKIELEQEGDIFYPKVDGVVWRSFSMNDIFDRYKRLQEHLDNNVIPDRDYDLHFSDAKIQDFFTKGKVAKTKYEKWQKGRLGQHEVIGDWQCSYCKYKDTCYGDE